MCSRVELGRERLGTHTHTVRLEDTVLRDSAIAAPGDQYEVSNLRYTLLQKGAWPEYILYVTVVANARSFRTVLHHIPPLTSTELLLDNVHFPPVMKLDDHVALGAQVDDGAAE